MIEIVILGVAVWLLWPRPVVSAKPVVIGLGEFNPPDPTQDGPKPADVLNPLVSATPRPGRFYKVIKDGPDASGDNGVLAQALNSIAPGRGSNATLRLKYLDHMTRGWNLIYSRNIATDYWPAPYNFRGVNIGPAWLPRNDNAVEAIVEGRMPKRTIAANGAETGGGSSYGLLWLPDIEADELEHAAAIRIKQRDDGSDPYMPPPELLSLLS